MGIINVTPDSFSDGGRFFDTAAALRRAEELIADGAELLDIGGESTRPGAQPVSAEEEIRRVIPVIAAVARRYPRLPISVDTSKAAVARHALDAGATIINDITALRGDPEMIHVLERHQGVRVVLMHMQGTPATMQLNPVYADVVGEIAAFFDERIAFCVDRGIGPERIILDPGIGFGKTTEHNLQILRHLDDFRRHGGIRYPLLIGLSRKSFIGRLLGSEEQPLPVEQRDAGTLALHVWCLLRGVDILRVHDVRAVVHAVRVLDAIAGGRWT